MLRIQDLGLSIRGKTILSTVSLDVNEGDLVVLLGPNGSGKSTLLKCIFGWLQSTSGDVLVNDKPVLTLRSEERANQIGWLPQRQYFAEPVVVSEVVAAGRFRFGESVKVRRQKAMEVLTSLGLDQLAKRNFMDLSGGESQRVCIAALIAQQSNCWLLDEPANHLDPAVQETVYNDLTTAWQSGQTMIVVTHDINLFLRSIPTSLMDKVRLIGINEGALCFETSLQDCDIAQKISILYGIPVQVVSINDKTQLLFGRFH